MTKPRLIRGKTLCPFFATCLHQDTCDRAVKEEDLTRAYEGDIMMLYVDYPYCYEIHSTDEDEEDDDFFHD